MAAFFGELAAFLAQTPVTGGNPMTGCGCLCAQAIWSIRVPWPGGRAATTGGWASVASSALLSFDVSGVLAAPVSEAVTGFGAVIGADVEIAEMLIARIPGCCAQP
jgi:hypothetical protein